jgi:hypothetical protein
MKIGIFIVPTGDLESWFDSQIDFNKMLEELQDPNSKAFENIGGFITEIKNYILNKQ